MTRARQPITTVSSSAAAARPPRATSSDRQQVADVFDAGVLIGRIGKRRKIMRAIRRSALQHRAEEIRLAPVADAVARIRRQVRHIERAEWRGQRQPAAEPRRLPRVLARGRTRGLTPGVAWHDAQPPALNTTAPLATSGVYGGSAAAETVAGIVSHQNTARPSATAQTATMIRRFSTRWSVAVVSGSSVATVVATVGRNSAAYSATVRRAARRNTLRYCALRS